MFCGNYWVHIQEFLPQDKTTEENSPSSWQRQIEWYMDFEQCCTFQSPDDDFLTEITKNFINAVRNTALYIQMSNFC